MLSYSLYAELVAAVAAADHIPKGIYTQAASNCIAIRSKLIPLSEPSRGALLLDQL
jgi:hypothetical protein